MKILNKKNAAWALADEGGYVWLCSIAYYKSDCSKIFCAYHGYERLEWRKVKKIMGLKHIKINATISEAL